MFRHETQIRVRYAETDQMGYLYYGNYATYYEVGRAEMIRSIGLTYQSMEDDYGILMPVMSLQMRFVRPARYDELIRVRTELRKLPQKQIVFHHELFNPKGKLVNGGSVKLCFVEQATNKTVDAPSFLTDKLISYFES